MTTVLYEGDVATEGDVTRLEDTIRQALQCDGGVCTFLESQPYRRIRRALLQRLNKVISHEADMYAYPHQYLTLHVQDARRVTLRMLHSSPGSVGDKATKVRKRDAASDAREESLRSMKRRHTEGIVDPR